MINIRKINTNILKAVARWASTTTLMFFSIAFFYEIKEYDFLIWVGISIVYWIALLPIYDGWE